MTNISWRGAKRPFQHRHPTHRPAHNNSDGVNAELVENNLVNTMEEKQSIRTCGGSSTQTYRISSRIVVAGNSGPYKRPVTGLRVTGDAEPYGEPNTFKQTMKKRRRSKTLPGPISGPHLDRHYLARDLGARSIGAHQSSTSALPVNA